MPSPSALLRPYGRAADLDVAFEGTDRPALVTALLARCSGGGEEGDAEAWWAQPVGGRIATLLRLAALTEGADTLAAQLRCPRPECGADVEIALPLGALAGAPAPDRIDVPLPDGRLVTVRPPTGEDQRVWSRGRFVSRHEAVAAVVDRLVMDGQAPGNDETALAAIGAALGDHDPLVDFTVSCVCPACAQPGDMAIDLEALALARLAASRRSILGDIHALASAYGWTEGEILAIPPERRARYRALIDGMTG